jgi:phosphocarrier protein HPr
MLSSKIVVRNNKGLHLRPACVFCEAALKYQSNITFKIGDTTANGKSILSVLAAGVKNGDEIELVCQGEDEGEALSYLRKLIKQGLGE